MEENKDIVVQEDKKPAKKVSEETLQIVTNLLITAISTAALMFSIAAGAKNRRKS